MRVKKSTIKAQSALACILRLSCTIFQIALVILDSVGTYPQMNNFRTSILFKVTYG